MPHQWQRHWWQIAAGINDTGGKFYTGINDTGGKFFHQFPLCCWHWWQICHRCQQYRWQIAAGVNDAGGKLHPVSTTLAANLPPVSTTPVANCTRYQRHWRQICHRCRWHRGQIKGTISGCRHLKLNLKAKVYIYFNSTQRCINKLLKIFCLKIFSICHRCRWHRWCTLSCEYLREFSKKIEMVVTVYSDASGKPIHEKKLKSKISWHCPFKYYILEAGGHSYVALLQKIFFSLICRAVDLQSFWYSQCAQNFNHSRLK